MLPKAVKSIHYFLRPCFYAIVAGKTFGYAKQCQEWKCSGADVIPL
jgi:hypothetical protein